jgi:hypothetical protein
MTRAIMMEILFIALMHLIQNPDMYHMQKVRVIGYASVEFESKALHVSRDDYDHAITKNAVWLDIELSDKIKKYGKEVVLVEGVFDKNNLGHLRMYSGSLKDIDRIEV